MGKWSPTTVWKYLLKINDDVQRVRMPVDSKILCVKMMGDTLTIWALVESNRPVTSRFFKVYGTGHAQDKDYAHFYIGTCLHQFVEMTYVWHVFEVHKIG